MIEGLFEMKESLTEPILSHIWHVMVHTMTHFENEKVTEWSVTCQ